MLLVLIVLAARNRLLFLAGPLASLRRGVTAEVVVLLGLVVAVAVLTALPPGRTSAAAARLRPVPVGPASPVLPPPGALVLAQESGRLAVALSARPAPGGGLRLTSTVIGPDANGVDDLQLTFGASGTRGATLEPGVPCGTGCYRATTQNVGKPRAVTINFAGETAGRVRFPFPRTWPAPSATALVQRAYARFRALHSVRYRENLASSPQRKISTIWTQVAPDRLQYSIRGGADGILIGATRWDRTKPGGAWVKSSSQAIAAPTPIWPRSPSDARLLAKTKDGYVVSLLDRSIPAWFTLRLDRRLRPRSLKMTAPAHFMHHDYLSFNRPLKIRPPR